MMQLKPEKKQKLNILENIGGDYMKLCVVGTGSSGNSYILSDNKNNCIILDCGLPFAKITHNKDFPSFKNIDLVFCSHIH